MVSSVKYRLNILDILLLHHPLLTRGSLPPLLTALTRYQQEEIPAPARAAQPTTGEKEMARKKSTPASGLITGEQGGYQRRRMTREVRPAASYFPPPRLLIRRVYPSFTPPRASGPSFLGPFFCSKFQYADFGFFLLSSAPPHLCLVLYCIYI